MAHGKACNPVSPGFRRGLFVRQEAPGGNPGTPGMKTTPSSMPHDGTQVPGSNPRRMAHGKACNPVSPGFRRGLFVRQEAPGGNPGTPGMKTTPPSMPHDRACYAGSNPHRMAPGKACNPVSPGFRRGLFGDGVTNRAQRWRTCTIKTCACGPAPPSSLHAPRGQRRENPPATAARPSTACPRARPPSLQGTRSCMSTSQSMVRSASAVRLASAAF